MNPRFSVIVPIYNIEAFLPQCIESILRQTYTEFELILVDDGSPDDCPKICDYYAKIDPRIRVIHKNNGGATSARRDASLIATGNYVCCIDGDDWIAPNYLEIMANSIEMHDVDIVCCNSYYANTKGIIENRSIIHPGIYKRENIEKEIFPVLMEDNKNRYFPSSLWAKAIRATLFKQEQIEVDSAIVIGEDRAVVIPCIYRSNCVVIVDDFLYYYRTNMQSITRNKKCFPWQGIEAFARHFPQRLNLEEYDFRAQYDRLITHQFFLTAKSQFNRDEPYGVIRREIIKKMHDSVFSEPIKHCRFSGALRAKLMERSLKRSIIMPIFVVCHIENAYRDLTR